ncbi:MAG: hypothetical protein FWC32_14250 [Firmicutes bacterium]|nr:hypothetical protein [Bacillota bacterium]
MKKFLCFVLVLCLVLAPVAVLAEEYDNGYEDATEVTEYATDATEYATDDATEETTEYATDEATDDATDETTEYTTDEATEYVAYDPTEYEEIVPVVGAVGQRWSFGLYDASAEGFSFMYYLDGTLSLAIYDDGLWIASAEGAEEWAVNPETGYVTPTEDFDVVIAWYAKTNGLFYITGSFISDSSYAFVLLNGAVVEGHVSELHYELMLEAGDELHFVTMGTESARWRIAIQEVEIPAEVIEEVTEVAEVIEIPTPPQEIVIDLPAPPPIFEITAPRPIDTVATRFVDGIQFVPFRATANVYGFFDLVWDGATATVTVVGLTSFTVAEAGGFNDNGTVYVPFAFALGLFEVPAAPVITLPPPIEIPPPIEEPTPFEEPTEVAEPTPYEVEEPTEVTEPTEYDYEEATEEDYLVDYDDEDATEEEPTDYDA